MKRLLLAAALLGAAPAPVASTTCPSVDFEVLLEQFMDSRELQEAFTLDPLPGSEVPETDYQMQYGFEKRSCWTLVRYENHSL